MAWAGPVPSLEWARPAGSHIWQPMHSCAAGSVPGQTPHEAGAWAWGSRMASGSTTIRWSSSGRVHGCGCACGPGRFRYTRRTVSAPRHAIAPSRSGRNACVGGRAPSWGTSCWSGHLRMASSLFVIAIARAHGCGSGRGHGCGRWAPWAAHT
jgi:hypothetical protein